MTVRVSFKKDASLHHLQLVTAAQGVRDQETGPSSGTSLALTGPPELEIDARQCTPKGASLNSTEIQFPNCIWESGAGDGVIAPVATAAASLAGGAASPETRLAGRLPLISRVPAALSMASSPAGATGQTRRSVQSWLMEQERGLPTPT